MLYYVLTYGNRSQTSWALTTCTGGLVVTSQWSFCWRLGVVIPRVWNRSLGYRRSLNRLAFQFLETVTWELTKQLFFSIQRREANRAVRRKSIEKVQINSIHTIGTWISTKCWLCWCYLKLMICWSTRHLRRLLCCSWQRFGCTQLMGSCLFFLAICLLQSPEVIPAINIERI